MRATILKTFTTGRQAIAKTFVFAIAIVSVVGCSARRSAPPPEAITDEGVVINGVRWATRNADGFRTFVASPEIMGGFYTSSPIPLGVSPQNGPDIFLSWHRLNRARDRYTLRRRSEDLTRRTWNPCPPGWRLPTVPEFESLVAAGSVWTAVNGVYGRLFGTAPHQLFLPAAGQFVETDREREVRDVNEMGYYLVNMPRVAMVFCQKNIGISRVHGFATEGLITGYIQIRGRPHSIATGFGTTNIFPELSLRCVAITDDD